VRLLALKEEAVVKARLEVAVPAVPAGVPVVLPGGMAKPIVLPPGGGFAPPGAPIGPGGLPPGVWIGPGRPGYYYQQPGQITLLEGKVKGEPTDYRSAVRIRALPDNRMFGAARDKEVLFALQITPEPRLRWQRLMGVKVDRAVDEKGQALVEPMSEATPSVGAYSSVPGFAPGFAPGAGLVVKDLAYRPYPYVQSLHQYAPVRLIKAATPSRTLKELTGIVTAEVLGDPQPLLVAEDVLKAKGKTFTGKHGGKFKINAVDNRPGGQVVINFEYEPVPGALAEPVNVPISVPVMPNPPPIRRGKAGLPGGGKGLALKEVPPVPVPPPPVGGGVAVGRKVMPTYQTNHMGISLKDDKGNFLPVNINMTFNPGVAGNREYQLTYVPQKDHGKVTSMAFTGRTSVAIGIPFTLKDVRLP
jgi:hypothetical protein